MIFTMLTKENLSSFSGSQARTKANAILEEERKGEGAWCALGNAERRAVIVAKLDAEKLVVLRKDQASKVLAKGSFISVGDNLANLKIYASHHEMQCTSPPEAPEIERFEKVL